jgi:hypothetical protein
VVYPLALIVAQAAGVRFHLDGKARMVTRPDGHHQVRPAAFDAQRDHLRAREAISASAVRRVMKPSQPRHKRSHLFSVRPFDYPRLLNFLRPIRHVFSLRHQHVSNTRTLANSLRNINHAIPLTVPRAKSARFSKFSPILRAPRIARPLIRKEKTLFFGQNSPILLIPFYFFFFAFFFSKKLEKGVGGRELEN